MDAMKDTDSFDEILFNDMNDYFLEQERVEQEIMATRSGGSSFSESYEEMPVYRSLDVMMPLPCNDHFDGMYGIDMVYEPPVLSKSSSIRIHPQPVDDLFDTLELEFSNSSVPCVSDPLCGVAITSVVLLGSLATITSSIASFLKSRDIFIENCNESSSLWKCQVSDFVDNCNFNIQIFYHDDETDKYTVEFLRISGSTLLFSSQFQSFKTAYVAKGDESNTKKDSEDILTDVPNMMHVDLTECHGIVECFLNWVSADVTEAIAALTGLLSVNRKRKRALNSASISPLLTLITRNSTLTDRFSDEGILVMTILANVCSQLADQDHLFSRVSTSFPLLSMMNMLIEEKRDTERLKDDKPCTLALLNILSTLIDSLSARLTTMTSCHNDVSGFERDKAICMMKVIDICA